MSGVAKIEPSTQSGQVLVEALLTTGILSILTVGSLTLLSRAYERGRCLSRFFWDAHSNIYSPSFRGEVLVGKCGAHLERLRFRTLDESGGVSVFLALWFVFISIALIAIVLWLEENRKSIALQLTLDTCVGQHAKDYSRTLNEFDALNEKIKVTRLMLTAGQILPPARAALSATLVALSAEQFRRVFTWNLRLSTWILRTGCSAFSTFTSPAPEWPFHANPPDSLGPTPWTKMHFLKHQPFWLVRKNRIAGAEVYYEKNRYRCRWKLPILSPILHSSKLLRTNAH